MPKDAKKNIDRYKIRGGELNEYDFHQNQEDYAEQQQKRQPGNLIPGTPPDAKKARAATKTTNKATKATKQKKAPIRGASAKKLAARKTAKKK